MTAAVADLLAAKKTIASGVIAHIPAGADVVVGVANGEPVTVLDAVEAFSDQLENVRIHQMLPLHDRAYFRGERPNLRHVSWFLSQRLREPFARGTVDLVPNNFSEVPHLLRTTTACSLVLTAASPPDEYGFFSLGPNAEYTAALVGEVPFFVEVNPRMPATRGQNQVHVRDVVGWCEADYPLVAVDPAPSSALDHTIAEFVAERIPDEATLQVGIGSVPERVVGMLAGHRRLGIHTELLSDGLVDLIESGAVTGEAKTMHAHKALATTALGSQRLYDYTHDNPGVEFWPVDYTNDPRIIGAQHRMNVVNATLEVDFLGQCASESIGSAYWSSSGGQADFVRGAMFSEGGQSFTVLHSTNHDASASRIVGQLHPGAAVTTFKNTVDKVVTEYGVAELRGRSIAERTRSLIAVAHPAFRESLERQAREIGFLRSA